MRRSLHVVVALSSIAWSTAVLRAQDGGIRTVVYDQDFDAPLALAKLQIVEQGLRVETDEFGVAVFRQVPPGRYTIVVAKDGYVRQVRSDVVVVAGQLVELRFDLVGEFTDMEEFVVQDSLQVGTGTEAALLDLRVESAALMDSISSELMSRAGAGDAAGALRLVAGASTQDGKSAVIRGLPDRYVSSQMNGVLLPSADKDKRAVELDQFPSEVIESVQVSKSFTPDQQGNASGGAVNVVLKAVPDEPFFMKWKTGSSYNTQTTGRGRFLSYQGGGVHAFGADGDERSVQELGENWNGAVGVSTTEAPDSPNFAFSGGGGFDIGGGFRAGGFVSFFYERDSKLQENVRDDSLWALAVGEPLTPQFSQGTPQSGDFFTSLLDITRSEETLQWGGLTTLGIQNDDHALNFAWLMSRAAADEVTIAEDTRGKQYFFPGHDPDVPTSPGQQQFGGAPYLRLQTLEYSERTAETLQLRGRHRAPLSGTGPLGSAELDWTLARSSAVKSTPDKRQFGVWWSPTEIYLPLKPAAQFQLGNLQRIFETTSEDSEEIAVGVKLPFELGENKKGYLKFGTFRDRVDRRFNQDTFSNFNQPNISFPGRFDEIDWSQTWGFEDHPITASDQDVDYLGTQTLSAWYTMIELPVTERLRAVGGVRFEKMRIGIVNNPEVDAFWIPPGQFGLADLLPGDGDVSYNKSEKLPSIGLVYDVVDGLTARAAYGETTARQTFRELSPIFQQEYLGGPIFVGNPDLKASSIRNYDLRLDYTPYEGGFFSASYFRKDIDDPIEYVEKLANFSITTAVNYPRGTLKGFELEARQGLGRFWDSLEGMQVGANSTWIDAKVRLPDDEIVQFESVQGVRPKPTRDMTNAPDYLFNLFFTYDIAPTSTSFGAFYTVQGDTLVQGPGPSNNFFVPATYETRYDSLSMSVTQSLGQFVKLTLAAKNLTDPERREVYRSEFITDDVLRRSHRNGVDYSLTLGGEIRF